MEKLTKKEEEIMHIIWQLERCTVSDVLEIIETETGERPPHSSVATIVQIMDKKGFLGHKAYGKTYEYFPMISKEDYGKNSLSKLVSDYFEGSAHNLVSFLVKDEKIDADGLKALLDKLE